MKIWQVGQHVEQPLATGETEFGIIIEVDDSDGKFVANPWIGIRNENGAHSATQKTLMSSGCKVVV